MTRLLKNILKLVDPLREAAVRRDVLHGPAAGSLAVQLAVRST